MKISKFPPKFDKILEDSKLQKKEKMTKKFQYYEKGLIYEISKKIEDFVYYKTYNGNIPGKIIHFKERTLLLLKYKEGITLKYIKNDNILPVVNNDLFLIKEEDRKEFKLLKKISNNIMKKEYLKSNNIEYNLKNEILNELQQEEIMMEYI